MRRKTVDVDYVKVLPEEQGKGLVEAVVAVFGNVDAVGDRIVKGAFAKSLDRWQQSGDPISVIYSHQWDNPDANIGEVIEAAELAPGDPRLPDHLKDLGGLYCKMQFDMDEKYASSVFQKVRKRRIKNWSFAYDIIEENQAKDANELLEIDVIEVGPTLVGANRETDTVGAKTNDTTININVPSVSNPEVIAQEVADNIKRLKSGRVLSAKNEGLIKEAMQNLQQVLSSLESLDEGKADGEAVDAKTSSPEGEKTDGEAVRAMTPLHVRLLLAAEEDVA